MHEQQINEKQKKYQNKEDKLTVNGMSLQCFSH